MEFIKKHYLFTIWVVAVVVTAYLKVPFWMIALGTLGYLLLVALMRLPSTIFWIGYILQGKFQKRDTAFRMYEYGYEHDARPAGPMIA